MNTPPSSSSAPARKPAVLPGAACWLPVLIGLAMLGPGWSAARGSEMPALKEHELKAAFLYNFTKFIEWPTNAFAGPDAPLVVAVGGASPLTAALEQIAKERKVQGRTLLIKTVTTAEAAREAHVLFMPRTEDACCPDWLAAARDRSVLTVGESAVFAKQGGMITFSIEGEKVRFEINMGQAEAAGLKVSAQLQKLARTVRRK